VEEQRGRGDAVSLLYIAGGIPAMVMFFVVFFVLVERCGIPG
jgi:hypothetical protein